MTAESGDFPAEHNSPCDALKDTVTLVREMNLRYVEDITGIRGDVKTIKEYMTNHWNEMREGRKEQGEVNKMVQKHDDFIDAFKNRKLEVQWGVSIVAGLIGSIPAIIMVIIQLAKK